MIFNQTFSEPGRHIYYPQTWGGRTAPELYEEMKKQLWCVIFVAVMQTVIGFVWWWILYSYWQLIKYLARLRQMDDNEPEKQDNMKYLGEDFRYRWIMFGLILLSITGMWVHFDWTRAALFYSGCLWGLCFVFRSFLLKKLEKFKAYMFELPTNKEQ